ncbi:MAG TPA: hypothetical protein VG733_17615 [Chthoniobacteraceae bacterium]|nr:hypothetical protein [Chthoniobacteraceae bacterium]
MNTKYLALFALAFGLTAWTLCAQDDKQQQPVPPPDAPMTDDNGATSKQPPPPPPDVMNSGTDQGQQQQPPPPPPPHPPVPLIIRALDANHDGIIDAQKIANAPAALKSLDKNGDGKLTPDEYMGPMPPPGGPKKGQGDGKDKDQDQSQGGRQEDESGSQQQQQQDPQKGPRRRPHPPVWPIIAALDANHDGIIDASEIANASEALKSLDKNGDGKLTPDEYMPKPPKPLKDGQQQQNQNDDAQSEGNGQQPPPPPRGPGPGPGGPTGR